MGAYADIDMLREQFLTMISTWNFAKVSKKISGAVAREHGGRFDDISRVHHGRVGY